MSAGKYYQMCQRGIGRPVVIRTVDGGVHRGVIHRVTRDKVYLQPMGGRGRRGYGGFGYPYRRGWGWGRGWGFGAGLGIGIGLGVIATLAFVPFII